MPPSASSYPIIVGDNRYFSFADEGLIEKYRGNFLNLKVRGVFETRVHYSAEAFPLP
jgi:hypothetical protein